MMTLDYIALDCSLCKKLLLDVFILGGGAGGAVSGCGAVGRARASDTRDQGFKSSHRPYYLLSTVLKRQNNQKMAIDQIKKVYFSNEKDFIH